MLTQAEFESLLGRYLAGITSADENELVERWYQQLGQQELPPLDEAESEALLLAIWTRVKQRIQANDKPKNE